MIGRERKGKMEREAEERKKGTEGDIGGREWEKGRQVMGKGQGGRVEGVYKGKSREGIKGRGGERS